MAGGSGATRLDVRESEISATTPAGLLIYSFSVLDRRIGKFIIASSMSVRVLRVLSGGADGPQEPVGPVPMGDDGSNSLVKK